MVGWTVRFLLLVAGTVTGWFVARDEPNFGVVQMVVALLLLTLAVAVVAFWPTSWTASLNRLAGASGHGERTPARRKPE